MIEVDGGGDIMYYAIPTSNFSLNGLGRQMDMTLTDMYGMDLGLKRVAVGFLNFKGAPPIFH